MVKTQSVTTAQPAKRTAKKATQSSDLVLLLMSDDNNLLDTIVAQCEKDRKKFKIAATEYDFVTRSQCLNHSILMPGDILTSQQSDQIYRQYYDWQEKFSAVRTNRGNSIQELSSPEGYMPSVESWLIRFGAHMHVRMRYIALLVELFQKHGPDQICVVGNAKNQPWALDILEKTIHSRFPQIQLVSPISLVKGDAEWELWSSQLRSTDAQALDHEGSIGPQLVLISKSLQKITKGDKGDLKFLSDLLYDITNIGNFAEVLNEVVGRKKILSMLSRSTEKNQRLREKNIHNQEKFANLQTVLRARISQNQDQNKRLKSNIADMKENFKVERLESNEKYAAKINQTLDENRRLKSNIADMKENFKVERLESNEKYAAKINQTLDENRRLKSNIADMKESFKAERLELNRKLQQKPSRLSGFFSLAAAAITQRTSEKSARNYKKLIRRTEKLQAENKLLTEKLKALTDSPEIDTASTYGSSD